MKPTVLVIGAGIAGTSAAFACAQRGHHVTVLERHAQSGTEASGNPAGILYPYMASHWDAGTAFYLSGFAHLISLLPQLEKLGARFSLCGMQHYPKQQSVIEREKLRALPALLGLPADVATRTDYGLFMPHSGWVDLPSLVRSMLQHPRITLHVNSNALSVSHCHGTWQVNSPMQSFTADNLIIANAWDAQQLFPHHTLPMHHIRGQITYIPEDYLHGVNHVLCYGGYLTPAIDGIHYLGATFEKTRSDLEVDAASHHTNLSALQSRFPERLRALPELTTLQGRAAYRTVSADRFPMVGQLCDEVALRQAMAGIPYQPHVTIPLLPSCYVTLAHSARGLVSAPLAGEMLAATIAQDLHMGALYGVGELLDPSRFVQRAWRKGEFIK